MNSDLDQEWIDEQKRVIDEELAKGMTIEERIEVLEKRLGALCSWVERLNKRLRRLVLINTCQLMKVPRCEWKQQIELMERGQ